MKIPEYNRQASLDIAPRSNVSIKEPEIFRDTSSVERIGKQMLGTAEDMSNIYLDMKKERDNGIVNEFMNQFSLERVNKLNELKEQYKGANSEGIVDAYMEWQEDYIAKRTGFNQDMADGELYLENDEQIKAARDTFAKNLPSTVNSLSNYVAQELETYKTNQFEASVANWTTQAVSDSEDNLQNHLNMLDSVVDNYYVGQPPEYIAQQKKKLKSNIYESRLNNAVLENPDNALILLQNDNYRNSLTADKLQTIEKSAINNWKSKIAGKMASANTLNPDDVLTERDTKIISPYVEKYGKDRLEWDIVREARRYINARKDAEKEKKTKDTIVGFSDIVDIQSNEELTSEQKTIETENILTQMAPDVVEDYRVFVSDLETEATYNNIVSGNYDIGLGLITDPKLKQIAIEEKERVQSIWSRPRDEQVMSNIMDIIDSGGTVKLSELHPLDAKMVFNEIVKNENMKKFKKQYKSDTGLDFDKVKTGALEKNKKIYKEVGLYNKLLDEELSNRVQAYKIKNGALPTASEMDMMVYESLESCLTENPYVAKLVDIQMNINQEGETRVITMSDYVDKISDEFEDVLDVEDINKLALYLASNQHNKALYLINPDVIKSKQEAKHQTSEKTEKGNIVINTVKDIAGGTVNIVNTIDDSLGDAPSNVIDTVSAPYAYIAEDVTTAALEIEEKYQPIAKAKKGIKRVAKLTTKPTEYITEQGITSAIDIANNIDNRKPKEIVNSDIIKQAKETYNELKNNEKVKSAYEMLEAKQKVYENNPNKPNAKEVEEAAIQVIEAAGNIGDAMFDEPKTDRKKKGWWGMLIDYMLGK